MTFLSGNETNYETVKLWEIKCILRTVGKINSCKNEAIGVVNGWKFMNAFIFITDHFFNGCFCCNALKTFVVMLWKLEE